MKKYTSILFVFLQVIFLMAPLNASLSETLTIALIDNLSSNYEVVIDESAVKGIKEAATEFVRLIEVSTDFKLSIVNKPTDGKKQIFIGKSQYTNIGFEDRLLEKHDSFILRVKNKNLYLIGKDDAKQEFYNLNIRQSASAGTYYAVIEFARRYLSARWYMPSILGEEIPKLRILKIPFDLAVSDEPRFIMRYIDIVNTKSLSNEIRAMKKGRLKNIYYNEEAVKLSLLWGRHLRLGSNMELNVGHSWYKWVPAEKPNRYSSMAYGKSNPEYFAVPGGRWRGYYENNTNMGGQLCICNDKVAEVMANNMINYAHKYNVRSFSLSPNDGKWSCKCDCCKNKKNNFKVNTIELTEEIVNFSNKVALRVADEVPDVEFGLYAYSWMSNPPKKLRLNSNITISDVYNGLPYRYYSGKGKNIIESNVVNWRKQVSSIVFTSYYTFYGQYSLPWSTPEVHEWLFDMLSSNASSAGVRMNYFHYDVPPMGALGADPWVLSEMLWNPDQDIRKLYNEYYTGAFGDLAGTYIQQYYSLIEQSMKEAVKNNRFNSMRGVKGYLLPAYEPIREQCKKLISNAVAAVSQMHERYRWRVSKIERGFLLMDMTVDMLLAEKAGDIVKAKRLLKERELFLYDEKSIFSLGREASDFQTSIVPLLN